MSARLVRLPFYAGLTAEAQAEVLEAIRTFRLQRGMAGRRKLHGGAGDEVIA